MKHILESSNDQFQFLNSDICIYLCEYLSNRDKLNFLSSSKHLHQLKIHVLFHEMVYVGFNKRKHGSKITTALTYYNNFTNVYSRDTNIIQFPSKMINLELYNNFNSEIKPQSIPQSVKKIIFGDKYDSPIYASVLPESLLELIFSPYGNFNQPIVLPQNLTRLELGFNFNQLIITLPPCLTDLTFGYMFNQPIGPEVIPSSVRNLTFGHNFNQSIQKILPIGIINLKFGTRFNQPIEFQSIPSSVTNLSFGNDFNQSIQYLNSLNITELRFGNDFNQPINTCLGPCIRYLYFGKKFNQTLERKYIPKSVRIISLENSESIITDIICGFSKTGNRIALFL